MGDSNDGLARILPALVFALLGLSAGSVLLQPRAASTSSSRTAAVAPGETDRGAAGAEGQKAGGMPRADEPVLPTGYVRALALVWDFLRSTPMLKVNPQGVAVVNEDAFGGRVPTGTDIRDTHGKLVAKTREAADRAGVNVQLIVASLPDYIDSNSAWTFDSLLEAIQQGAASTGFVLDRFYLPDWDPTERDQTAKTRSATNRLHEVDPGAVLFRTVNPAAERSHADLLLVLVVPESATFGVHKAALQKALEFVAAWNGDAPDRLAILGPQFSGSAWSLRETLVEHLCQGDRPYSGIEIVSGSATSPMNSDLLTLSTGTKCLGAGSQETIGVPVTFAATTHPDDDPFFALANYLGEINPPWRCGDEMALLVESNTGWGNQVFKTVDQSHDEPCSAKPGQLFPRALRIGFPMHISRLRTDAEGSAQSAQQPARPAAPATSLRLGEGAAPTDRLPSFRPQLTAAMVETLLRSILGTIHNSNVTALGIMATDKRDHVFLAHEIAHLAPNLQMFTVEHDLVFIHPDADNYTRGTLVASTYPLNDRTQLLTRPMDAKVRRVQFSTFGAAGVFNAMQLIVRSKDDDRESHAPPTSLGGTRAAASPSTRTLADTNDAAGAARLGALVDYVRFPALAFDGVPFDRETLGQKTTRPPVWLSVVTSHNFQPVGIAPPAPPGDPARSDHMAPAGVLDPSEAWPTSKAPYLEGSAVIAFAVLAAAAALCAHLFAAALAVGWSLERWARQRRIGALLRRSPWLRRASSVAHRVLPALAFSERRRWGARLATVFLTSVGRDAAGGQRAERGSDRLAHETRVSVFAATFVVLAVSLWVLQLAAVWWCDQRGLDPATFLSYTQVAVWVSRIVFLAALVPTVHPFWVSFRVLPFAFGTYAFWRFGDYLVGPDFRGLRAVLHVERTLSPGALLSPGVVVVALCALLWAWAAWNLRRVRAFVLTESAPNVLRLLLQRTPGGEPARSITQDVPLRMGPFIVFPLVVMAIAIAAGGRYRFTIEGPAFSDFLWWGTVCVLATMGHTLAHTGWLGHRLLKTLRALDRHPIAGAFERVAAEGEWRPSYVGIASSDFEPLTHRVRRMGRLLNHALRTTDAGAPPDSLPGRRDATLSTDRRRARVASRVRVTPAGRQLSRLLRLRAEDSTVLGRLLGSTADRTWDATNWRGWVGIDPANVVEGGSTLPGAGAGTSSSPGHGHLGHVGPEITLWRRLDRVAPALWHLVQRFRWDAIDPVPSKDTTALVRFHEEAETLLAMQMALVVKETVTRIVSGLSLAVFGTLGLMGAHLFYTFQGRQFWLSLDWVVLGVVCVTAVSLLVRIEKDAVLSRLWKTTPGRISWTGGYIYRMAGYVAIPLITMFATMFPEVGSGLITWLEPMRGVLP